MGVAMLKLTPNTTPPRRGPAPLSDRNINRLLSQLQAKAEAGDEKAIVALVKLSRDR